MCSSDLLEILAGKLDKLAQTATSFSASHSSGSIVNLESYYRGKACGLSLAADLLRQEALSRKATDKEKAE